MRHSPAGPRRRVLRTTILCWSGCALVVSCGVAITTQAAAQSVADWCPPQMTAWLDGCAHQSGLTLHARSCPPGRLVVAVEPPGAGRFDIEVRKTDEPAFRNVPGFAISPVGEFPDWSREPQARRDAFDAVAQCVRDAPSLPLAAPRSTDPEPRHTSPEHHDPVRRSPWLLVSALLVACAAWWMLRRSSHVEARELAPKRSFARLARDAMHGRGVGTSIALALLGVACGAYRWIALPRGFFHQNGQGPLWIQQAVEESPGLSDYGPGYAEVFGWIARAAPHAPDSAVFVSLALASAAIPAMAWSIARRSGARAAAAWSLAMVLATHPLLGRLAQSESYFGVGLFFLFAAAWVLSTTGTRPRLTAPALWLGVAASGLSIAQAARIHPVLWGPACAVPAVLLVQPGRWRRRLLQTALAAAGIGVVVLATTGPTLLAIFTGLRTHPLRPVEQFAIEAPGAAGWLALLALIALAFTARSRVRAAFAVAVLTVGVTSMRATDILRANYLLVSHAYPALWSAPLLAAALSLLQAASHRAPRLRAWIQAGVVLVVGATLTVPWWSEYTREPTDQREQAWAMVWRRNIEPGATVAYLGRAGDRLLALPLYGRNAVVMRSGEPPPSIPETSAAPAYYYRSSLCSTDEGKAACADFERALRLAPIEVRDLPALGSHPWQPLGPDPVRVGLYRISHGP